MPTGFHWFQVVSEPVEGLPSVFLSDVALQTGGNWRKLDLDSAAGTRGAEQEEEVC